MILLQIVLQFLSLAHPHTSWSFLVLVLALLSFRREFNLLCVVVDWLHRKLTLGLFTVMVELHCMGLQHTWMVLVVECCFLIDDILPHVGVSDTILAMHA